FKLRARDWDEPITAEDTKVLKEWEYLKLKDEIAEFVGGSDPSEPFRFLPQKIRVIQNDKLDLDYGPQFEPSPLSVSETLERWLTKEKMLELAENAGWNLRQVLAPTRTTPAVIKKPISFRRGEQRRVEQPSPGIVSSAVPNKRKGTIEFGTPTVSFDLNTATWIIESHPANLFFIRFGLTLIQEGVSQLSICPECRRIFYRVRKQKYCSKTCINRVSRRKWLENPKNKKKDRRWAR